MAEGMVPSVKVNTAGSAANKVLKVVAVVLTVFIAAVVLFGSVLVVVPSAWRAYSALSGAGSSGDGAFAPGYGAPMASRDYYVVWVGEEESLVVDNLEARRAYIVETSGFSDIGAAVGDRVRLERPRVENGGWEIYRDLQPLAAESWALVEAGAVGTGDIACAGKYAWFGILGGRPDPWDPSLPDGGEEVMSGDALAISVSAVGDSGGGLLASPDEAVRAVEGGRALVDAGGTAVPCDEGACAAAATGLAESLGMEEWLASVRVWLPFASQRPQVVGVRYVSELYVIDVRVLRGADEAGARGAGA